MNGDTTALTTVPAPAVPQEAAAPASSLTALGLSDLYKLGKALTPTGFLPAAIKTPEQALAVMLKGQELRIPPMQALSTIVVIQGKPTASAELMLALIYRDQGDGAVVFTEASATAATISYKRRGWRDRQTFTFDLQDAKTAQLTTANWAKYPAAMLRARCISAVARMAFPDTIGGMYTPEELGATIDVETGEILLPPVAPHRGASLAPLPAPRTLGTADTAKKQMDAEVARPSPEWAPRPAPAVHEPFEDDAPHPADTEGAPESEPPAGRTIHPLDLKPDFRQMSGMVATAKQIQTIEGLLKRAQRPPPDDLTQMTRAAASELISELIGVVGVERR